jgi:hypothetical protein
MTIINFIHPVTPEQVSAIERLCGCHVDHVLVRSSQIDPGAGISEQVSTIGVSGGI